MPVTPWPISQPITDMEVKARIDALIEKYKNNWDELPDYVLQAVPAQVA